MKWLEASVRTTPERIDALCWQLEELGVEGMSIEDEADFQRFIAENGKYWDSVDDELVQHFSGLSRVRFYLTDDEDGRAQLARIRSAVPEEIVDAVVDDSQWQDEWKKYYRVIETGERLAVVPEWETYDNPGGRTELRMDPGLTFGTGAHATTHLCLKTLERYARPGVRCLDIGCGSGILAVGACVLGCDSACCCDIDPLCEVAVRRNAGLNGLDETRVCVRIGDVLSSAEFRRGLGTGYGLVLANIVADVIVPLTAHVGAFLAPDGVFVCSGIIEGRQDDVEAALQQQGFEIVSHEEREGWHCFAARHA